MEYAIISTNMAKQYWLMKSEPKEFSIEDLEKRGQELWEGVRNYQVRNMFRDQMKVGDMALFYHSSTENIGVVGEIKIENPDAVDPAQFDKKSKYYDPKANKENPTWLGPTVSFVRKFDRVVTLSEIRNNPLFANLALVKKGNRLSVMPISKDHYLEIVKLSKLKKISG
jgi:predicted RNA-binding protein with PUA-like domain